MWLSCGLCRIVAFWHASIVESRVFAFLNGTLYTVIVVMLMYASQRIRGRHISAGYADTSRPPPEREACISAERTFQHMLSIYCHYVFSELAGIKF